MASHLFFLIEGCYHNEFNPHNQASIMSLDVYGQLVTEKEFMLQDYDIVSKTNDIKY